MSRLTLIGVLFAWWPVALSAQGEAGVELTSPLDLLLRVGLGLVVVLVTIAVASWAARGFFKTRLTAGGPLRVLAGLSLGTRERVVLLQVGDTQLVLGVSPGRIQTLHVLSEPLAGSQPPDGETKPFAKHLTSMMEMNHDPAANGS